MGSYHAKEVNQLFWRTNDITAKFVDMSSCMEAIFFRIYNNMFIFWVNNFVIKKFCNLIRLTTRAGGNFYNCVLSFNVYFTYFPIGSEFFSKSHNIDTAILGVLGNFPLKSHLIVIRIQGPRDSLTNLIRWRAIDSLLRLRAFSIGIGWFRRSWGITGGKLPG